MHLPQAFVFISPSSKMLFPENHMACLLTLVRSLQESPSLLTPPKMLLCPCRSLSSYLVHPSPLPDTTCAFLVSIDNICVPLVECTFHENKDVVSSVCFCVPSA